jgi:hypothetical protein
MDQCGARSVYLIRVVTDFKIVSMKRGERHENIDKDF